MRIDHCNAGGTMKLDTLQLADGYSELRIVAIEAGHADACPHLAGHGAEG